MRNKNELKDRMKEFALRGIVEEEADESLFWLELLGLFDEFCG